MNVERCANGHFYDRDRYGECPHCGAAQAPHPEPARTIAHDAIREQVTVPKASYGSPKKEDEARESKTIRHMGEKDTKTVGYFSKRIGADPVVGWLVCTEGAERGRDYRLRYGRNFIGRSAKMDVCIVEDEQISRDNHASIIYEPKKNEFILTGGEGTSTSLNDKLVTEPGKLKDGDTIKIGSTLLQFIAYCKGDTKWEEN